MINLQSGTTVKKERDSNVELARIIAMCCIVLGHFICFGVFDNNEMMNQDYVFAGRDRLVANLTFFVMFGTDLFALISGYYRVRLSWKSFLSLWFLVVFYNLLSVFVSGETTLSSIAHAFFISGRTNHWYFAAYLWLLVFSPILNSGLASLSLSKKRISVLLVMFLCCFSGWFLESVNVNGHNLMQLVGMYIVGAWLSEETRLREVHGYVYLLFYLLSSLLGMLFVSLYSARGMTLLLFHNNPFSIISSVCVFLFFLSLRIKSKAINSIALSMPALLMLTGKGFGSLLNPFVHRLYVGTDSLFLFSLYLLAILVLCIAVSVIIDSLRRMMFNPLVYRLSRTLQDHTRIVL